MKFVGSKILFSMMVLSTVALASEAPPLQPVKGIKHAEAWRGRFEVTKCHICEDVKLGSDFNLKNLVAFGLDFAIVQPPELPDCATTNLAVADYFEIGANSGQERGYLSRSFGMCEWQPTTSFQILDISDDFFHYRKQKRAAPNKTVFMEEIWTIDRLEDNRYLVHRIVVDPNPNHGLPKKYVYLFEAKRVSTSNSQNFGAKAAARQSEYFSKKLH